MNSPLREPPLRLPGQSTDKRLYDVLFSKVMFFALMTGISSGLIVSEWLRFFLSIPPNPILVTLLLSSVIAFSVLMIRKNKKYILQLKQGRDGERVVGQILEELRADGAIIFHDIISNQSNIDHVVVSRIGIFTVETKTWSKRSAGQRVTYDGKTLLVNGYPPDRDPIKQSKAEANWLKIYLEKSAGRTFNIRPMIVFPGWYVESTGTRLLLKEQGVLLLSANAVIGYLRTFDEVFSDEDIQLVSNLLSHYVKTTQKLMASDDGQ